MQPETATRVRPATAERFPQTFDDVKAAEVGHVFCDEFDEGVRFVILRGPGSLCAYVGIPSSHPLAGWEYDDLNIDCHGGLTYSGSSVHGDGSTYWYGWDYNHSGDRGTYDRIFPSSFEETEWTPAMVYENSWSALYEFKRAVRLAEKIARRGWQTTPKEHTDSA